MSYTDEIKQIDTRMDSFEEAIKEMRRDQQKGFDRLSHEIEGLKTGIHGNKEHDQIGYRQRINGLEEKVTEHEEFKKKILLIVSLITSLATVLINILIQLFEKFL